MRRSLLAATALALGISGSAVAADLPIEVPASVVMSTYNWTGFYAGVHAGYGWRETDVRTSGDTALTSTNVGLGLRPAGLSSDQDGFVGGGQLGFNWQFGSFVVGVEADISYTDLSGAVGFQAGPVAAGGIGAPGGQVSVFSSELEYLGTLRARLGYAFDRSLIYATGGLAYGRVNNSAAFFGPGGGPLQYVGGSGGTETGYVIGAGFEHALASFNLFGQSAVTVRLEYLYYDLGDRSVTVFSTGATPAATGSYTANFENTGHIVRAGVNVRF